jgi:hypothetical protein
MTIFRQNGIVGAIGDNSFNAITSMSGSPSPSVFNTNYDYMTIDKNKFVRKPVVRKMAGDPKNASKKSDFLGLSMAKVSESPAIDPKSFNRQYIKMRNPNNTFVRAPVIPRSQATSIKHLQDFYANIDKDDEESKQAAAKIRKMQLTRLNQQVHLDINPQERFRESVGQIPGLALASGRIGGGASTIGSSSSISSSGSSATVPSGSSATVPSGSSIGGIAIAAAGVGTLAGGALSSIGGISSVMGGVSGIVGSMLPGTGALYAGTTMGVGYGLYNYSSSINERLRGFASVFQHLRNKEIGAEDVARIEGPADELSDAFANLPELPESRSEAEEHKEFANAQPANVLNQDGSVSVSTQHKGIVGLEGDPEEVPELHETLNEFGLPIVESVGAKPSPEELQARLEALNRDGDDDDDENIQRVVFPGDEGDEGDEDAQSEEESKNEMVARRLQQEEERRRRTFESGDLEEGEYVEAPKELQEKQRINLVSVDALARSPYQTAQLRREIIDAKKFDAQLSSSVSDLHNQLNSSTPFMTPAQLIAQNTTVTPTTNPQDALLSPRQLAFDAPKKLAEEGSDKPEISPFAPRITSGEEALNFLTKKGTSKKEIQAYTESLGGNNQLIRDWYNARYKNEPIKTRNVSAKIRLEWLYSKRQKELKKLLKTKM